MSWYAVSVVTLRAKCQSFEQQEKMQPLTTSWQVVMIPAQHAQEPISACFTPHFRCFQVDIIWVALKYNPRIISIPNFIGGNYGFCTFSSIAFV
jgi:hypothetical protein